MRKKPRTKTEKCWTQVNRLHARGYDLWLTGQKLQVEGYRLWVAGNQLRKKCERLPV